MATAMKAVTDFLNPSGPLSCAMDIEIHDASERACRSILLVVSLVV